MNRYLVFGYGVSGKSAAKFLLQKGESVAIFDDRLKECDLPEVRFFTEKPTFSDFDKLVISPGVPMDHPLILEARQNHLEVFGEAELAFRNFTQPILGITGTNGKTTVTQLVTHVLNHSGRNAKALGNIGEPLTSVTDFNGIIVAELSSYQLETLATPILEGAALLNITPDHLDRYGTMERYAEAKFRIQKLLKPLAPLIIEEQTANTFSNLLDHTPTIIYGNSPHVDLQIQKNIELFSEIPYIRRISHDQENEAAAYALCRVMGVTANEFFAARESFRKPAHRIEFVRKRNGVSYYNDSKGTNLDSVLRAVDLMSGPVVLIAGGRHKGAPFTPWLQTFADKVRCVFAIGEAAEQLKKDLEPTVSVSCCESLESAIQNASTLAREGENVLLSPGCSSFDMFPSFEHRGDRFKEIVQGL